MKGEVEVNKCSWCFCFDCVWYGHLQKASLCFSLSFSSFLQLLLEFRRSEREADGAGGSRQGARGLLSNRDPLSSAYLKFSLSDHKS